MPVKAIELKEDLKVIQFFSCHLGTLFQGSFLVPIAIRLMDLLALSTDPLRIYGTQIWASLHLQMTWHVTVLGHQQTQYWQQNHKFSSQFVLLFMILDLITSHKKSDETSGILLGVLSPVIVRSP